MTTVRSLCAGIGLALSAAVPIAAIDCTGTATGNVPLNDLGPGLYLGEFEGGLYPEGLNEPPASHHAEGRARAGALAPLGTDGLPDPSGALVLLSIGYSNVTQEYCSAGGGLPCDPWTFVGQAAADPRVRQDDLVLVNGAKGGEPLPNWDEPTDANYDRIRDTRLAPLGLTEEQVQVVWMKLTFAGPTSSLPAIDAEAYLMLAGLGDVARTLRTRYPMLKMVFLSSRIYAGYATTGLHPEPYAYESAFGMKWLIEAQIEQMAGGGIDPTAGDLDFDAVAPWLAWGPYLWADGLTPRSDGLIWECDDFESDGTHPAQPAESKVGFQLLDFMLTSPYTAPWFRAPIFADGFESGDTSTWTSTVP